MRHRPEASFEQDTATRLEARSAEAARRGVGKALLAWYDANRRDLPWRRTRDPYAIWVSEMMLQQTQVKTAIDYFGRWMTRFPTVDALASATEGEVLHAWQGLGYYRRAKNLLRAAEVVVNDHGGRLPDRVDALLRLPGIGRYSAGAISSIAYGAREPVVDGNVVRVLCRLLGLRGDPTRTPLKNDLWTLARALMPQARPGDFNQAMMELGATVCTPRDPDCDACPLARRCTARRAGTALELPELPARRTVEKVLRVAVVVRRRASVLCARVPSGARRVAGRWEFPNTDGQGGESGESAAERAVLDATGSSVSFGQHLFTVRHSVTHHRITLEVLLCRLAPGGGSGRSASARWVPIAGLAELAMPAPHRRIARRLAT
jgi:A/G-specific adenine glycosylase